MTKQTKKCSWEDNYNNKLLSGIEVKDKDGKLVNFIMINHDEVLEKDTTHRIVISLDENSKPLLPPAQTFEEVIQAKRRQQMLLYGSGTSVQSSTLLSERTARRVAAAARQTAVSASTNSDRNRSRRRPPPKLAAGQAAQPDAPVARPRPRRASGSRSNRSRSRSGSSRSRSGASRKRKPVVEAPIAEEISPLEIDTTQPDVPGTPNKDCNAVDDKLLMSPPKVTPRSPSRRLNPTPPVADVTTISSSSTETDTSVVTSISSSSKKRSPSPKKNSPISKKKLERQDDSDTIDSTQEISTDKDDTKFLLGEYQKLDLQGKADSTQADSIKKAILKTASPGSTIKLPDGKVLCKSRRGGARAGAGRKRSRPSQSDADESESNASNSASQALND